MIEYMFSIGTPTKNGKKSLLTGQRSSGCSPGKATSSGEEKCDLGLFWGKFSFLVTGPVFGSWVGNRSLIRLDIRWRWMAPVWLPKQCKLGSQASRNFVFEKCCDEKMFGKILYLSSIKSSAYTIPDLIKVNITDETLGWLRVVLGCRTPRRMLTVNGPNQCVFPATVEYSRFTHIIYIGRTLNAMPAPAANWTPPAMIRQRLAKLTEVRRDVSSMMTATTSVIGKTFGGWAGVPQAGANVPAAPGAASPRVAGGRAITSAGSVCPHWELEHDDICLMYAGAWAFSLCLRYF